jgi:hypothetical protein
MTPRQLLQDNRLAELSSRLSTNTEVLQVLSKEIQCVKQHRQENGNSYIHQDRRALMAQAEANLEAARKPDRKKLTLRSSSGVREKRAASLMEMSSSIGRSQRSSCDRKGHTRRPSRMSPLSMSSGPGGDRRKQHSRRPSRVSPASSPGSLGSVGHAESGSDHSDVTSPKAPITFSSFFVRKHTRQDTPIDHLQRVSTSNLNPYHHSTVTKSDHEHTRRLSLNETEGWAWSDGLKQWQRERDQDAEEDRNSVEHAERDFYMDNLETFCDALEVAVPCQNVGDQGVEELRDENIKKKVKRPNFPMIWDSRSITEHSGYQKEASETDEATSFAFRNVR